MMRLDAGDNKAVVVNACGIIAADCGGLQLFKGLREPVCEDMATHPEVRSAFELLLKELERPRFGSRALAEALMKQCLIVALREQVERGELSLMRSSSVGDRRLMKAFVAILENPAHEHSLEELAKLSGMSRSLFTERFGEAFGRPPIELVKQVRLHRAASLLRETDLPVQIIGRMVGYESRTYFSRAFRAAHGADPRRFRISSRTANGLPGAAERSASGSRASRQA